MRSQFITKPCTKNLTEVIPLKGLITFVDHDIGALLLASENLESPDLCFVFALEGFQVEVSLDECATQVQALQKILFNLPDKGFITFDGQRRPDSSLSNPFSAAENTPSALQFLTEDKRHRIAELGAQGKRHRLAVYLRYTIPLNPLPDKPDVFDRLLSLLRPKAEDIEACHQDLMLAFEQVQRFAQQVTQLTGLTLTALPVAPLWTYVARCAGNTAPSPPAAMVQVGGGTINEVFNQESAAAPPALLLSLLAGSEPEAHNAWIETGQHGNRDYTAVLYPQLKPGAFAHAKQQYQFLWSVALAFEAGCVQVVSQFSKTNTALERLNQESLALNAQRLVDKADRFHSVNPSAALKSEIALDAVGQMVNNGKIPVKNALVVVLSDKTPKQLKATIERFHNHVLAVGNGLKFRWETEMPWAVWRQLLPTSRDPLLLNHFNWHGQTYFQDIAPAFMPVVYPKSPDSDGVEFISREGGLPVYLNPFAKTRRIGIFGTTRSGKSATTAQYIFEAVAHKMPVTMMDLPKADGSGTFSALVPFLGGQYIDILTRGVNLLAQPLLPEDKQQREARLSQWRSSLTAVVAMIGHGPEPDNPAAAKLMRELVTEVLTQFLTAPGADSQTIEQPTLQDFLVYLHSRDVEVLAEGDTAFSTTLQTLKRTLRAFLQTPLGTALCQHNTDAEQSPLLIFALPSGVGDKAEKTVMAMAMYAIAERRALSAATTSLFVIDEAPSLFETERLAACVARLFAAGAKMGISTMLLAQDPDSVAQTAHSSMILQNIDTLLIGRINESAIPSFARIFGYDPAFIRRNASPSFYPQADGLYSQWLLDTVSTKERCQLFCRFYPGYALLALVANNKDEQAIREAVLSHYQDDIYQGICCFARLLVQSMTTGRALKTVYQENLPTLPAIEP